MRKPFVIWTVKEQEYKLKLTTADISRLEEIFNMSLIQLISEGTMPALNTMLKVVHASLSKYHHGLKVNDVYELFDDYIDEGGSQVEFMTDVFIPLYEVSGFLSLAQADQMHTNLDTAKEQM